MVFNSNWTIELPGYDLSIWRTPDGFIHTTGMVRFMEKIHRFRESPMMSSINYLHRVGELVKFDALFRAHTNQS